jgi:hypothetical protein
MLSLTVQPLALQNMNLTSSYTEAVYNNLNSGYIEAKAKI